MMKRFFAWYKANQVSRYVLAALIGYVGELGAEPFIGAYVPRFVAFAVFYSLAYFIMLLVWSRRAKPLPPIAPRPAGSEDSQGA